MERRCSCDQDLDVCGQFEEAERICDRTALLSGAAGDFVVAELELAGETVECVGYFDGIEVLALDVLDEGDLEEAVVGDVLDGNGNIGDAGEACGTPAAFAGDELVAAVPWADDEGLNDAVGADGVGKFLEALRLEYGSWLKRIGVDEIDRNAGRGSG